MKLPNPFKRFQQWRDDRKRRRVGEQIHEKLDQAHRDAPRLELVLERDPVIIFSDQHKGARDGADDFQRCERSYNAALAYYNHVGYRLVVLGDVEELWENSFEEVSGKYEATLRLEAAFHSDGRYTRLWGNHDLAWKDRELFQEKMAKHGVGDVEPIEALRLVVRDGEGGVTGELFLAHGHQGTADSDRYAALSQFAVRRGWRWLQRRLNRPWNTPSVDWALRGEHAGHMADWAAQRKRVLIAGHTHLPVFYGETKKPAVTPDDVTAPEAVTDPDRAEALRLARLSWAEAEQRRLAEQQPIPLDKPCYFNTGCCSFGDGDVTGIELSEGRIRLVRWPCVPDLDRDELASMELTEVFRLASG
jgi:hypothetical protein